MLYSLTHNTEFGIEFGLPFKGTDCHRMALAYKKQYFQEMNIFKNLRSKIDKSMVKTDHKPDPYFIRSKVQSNFNKTCMITTSV